MQLPDSLTDAARTQLQRWLTEPAFEPWRDATRALAESGDAVEINDAFGTEIRFGTGGIRGRCGPGPGRMNGWVVGRATQGLADWLKARGQPLRVVVGHDARNGSEDFARTACRVLAAAGVEVFGVSGLCTTPQLSFSVIRLGCGAGIMITASHNPPADNGYKCYNAAGHQFAPPQDADLVGFVEAAGCPPGTGLPAFDAARADGRIRPVPEPVRAEYLASAVASSRLTGLDTSRVSILYTPYHGAGSLSVLPALRAAGFAVRMLESQARPDPRFPTLPGGVANPEEPPTFFRALLAARDADDVVLASDPDADRIGAMVRRRPDGEWIWLDGHRLMTLLGEFAVRRWTAGAPARCGVVSRSLVTTAMLDRAVAAAAGGRRVRVASDLLVGLKYTGRLIAELAGSADEEFVFGGEEAHGYLSGTHCLDKDAANAACLLGGVAAECKAAGVTVWQRYLDFARRFGAFANPAANLSLTAAEGGMARADRILSRLRGDPPRTLAGRPVKTVIDYRRTTKTITDVATGAVRTEPCDPGNVLVFVFSDDGLDRLTVRPSGTEPKMKLYAQRTAAVPAGADDAAVEAALDALEAEAASALATVAAELRRM
jgi:phosphomannomutase